MKILGVFGFVLILSLSISITMDMLLGFTFFQAFPRLLNPVMVNEPGEYVIIGLLFIIIIGQQIFYHLKNKPDKQKPSN